MGVLSKGLEIDSKLLVAVVSIFLVIGIYLQKYLSKRGKLPLPPGPTGLPILGNILDLAAAAKEERIHILLERWAREFGEVVRVQNGPVVDYFLNSDRAVKALLDKSSVHTSDRPRWIMANKGSNSWSVLLLGGHDQRWKQHRKVIHSEMTSPTMADVGIPFLHYETAKFLHEVAHDPAAGSPSQDLWTQIGRYTYSNFSMQTFGFDIPTSDHPAIPYIHKAGARSIQSTLPGSYIVDILPFLDRLPLRLKSWEREARTWFKEDLHWVREQMLRVQKVPQNDSNALLLRILRDEKRLGMGSDNEAAYLSLIMITAASDTSRISTWAFLEAMMSFPDVQSEAQAEVDRLVGDRIPVWEDFERSPYLRCVMTEIWRWRPPVALGITHTTTKELEYNGMRIPKGSRLSVNAWAIGRDPHRHEDPERFWPQRYKDDLTTTQQSINLADPTKRDHFAFGAGRRVCPGNHVAERSVGVAMMRILWAFNVGVKSTAKLPLDTRDYPGIIPGSTGENLPVILTPRSVEKVRLIDEAWAKEKSSWGR